MSKVPPRNSSDLPNAGVESVASGTITITWDPDARLAVQKCVSPTQATGTDAEVLLNALTKWIGSDRTPFGMLTDAAGLQSVDTEWRSVRAAFARQHRDDAYVAVFNAGPVINVVREMVQTATGLQQRTFADEASARAWLRTKGIQA